MGIYSIFFGFLVLGLMASVTGPIIPWLVREFGLTFSTVGQIFLFTGFGRIVTSLYLGMAGSRFNDKSMVKLGITIIGLSCLAVALFPHFLVLLWAMLILGGGWGFLEGGSNALVGRLNQGHSGSSLNQLHLFFGIGALVGPLIASSIATYAHWRYVYLLLSVLYLIFWLWLRQLRVENVVLASGVNKLDTAMLKHRSFLLFAAICFLYVSQEVGLGGWMNTYWAERYQADQMAASLVVTIFWIAFTVGRGFCSWLVSRYDRLVVLQWMFSGMVGGYLLLYVSPWPWLSGFLVVLIGFSMSGVFPTVASLAMDSFPGQQLSISGYTSAAAGVGVMLGPWVAGVVWDHTSILALPIWGLVFTSLLVLSQVQLKSSKRIVRGA